MAEDRAGGGSQGAATGDAERTKLATERTMLAWWRTALASLAVALAVGRLLPDLAESHVRWPYVLLGLGFGVFATGLFVYGSARETSTHRLTTGRVLATAFATLLALGTIVLIAVY